MGDMEPDRLAAELESASEHMEWLQALAVAIVADRHTAEDLVQRALQAAAQKPHWEPGRLRAWLAGVVRNLAKQHFRTESRRRAREQRVVALAERRAEGIPDAAPTPHPEELAQQVESQQLLAGAVMDLPEKYREVMLQFYYGEWSQKRIAEHHGLSVRAVETRLRRGRERLRTRLEGEYGKDSWAMALLPLLTRIPPPKLPPPIVGAGPGSLGAGWWASGAAGILLIAGLTLPSAEPDNEQDPLASQGTAVERPQFPSEEPAAGPLERESTEVASVPDTMAPAAAGTLRAHCIERGTGHALADHPVRLHFLRQRRPGEFLPPDHPQYFSPRDRVFVKLGDGQTKTDAEGLAQLELPEGTTLLYLTDGLHSATHSRVGYGSGGIAIPRPPQTDLPLELEMVRRTGSASGYVLDRQGVPIAEALVDVFHYAQQLPLGEPTMTVLTAADGSFTIPDIACDQGGFELRPRKSGHAPLRRLRTDRYAGFGKDYPGISLLLDAEAGSRKVQVEHQGMPVAGAVVTMMYAPSGGDPPPRHDFGSYLEGVTRTGTTDAQGRLVFHDFPEQPGWIQVEKPGFRPLSLSQATAAESIVLSLDRGATLALQINTFDGASAAGALVGYHDATASRYLRADPAGQVRFQGLTLGTSFSLTVLHGDYALSEWAGWKVQTDLLEESIVLQPGFTLEGQLLADHGSSKSLPPRLFVRRQGEHPAEHLRSRGLTTPSLWQLAGIDVTRPDREGDFRFQNLPAGPVELWWGQRRRPMAFALAQAGDADLQLSPGDGMAAFAQVDLQVTERSSGRPVPEYFLYWTRGQGDLPLVKVRNPEGRHTQLGLDPGFWSLTVWAPQGYTTTQLARRHFPAGPTLLEVQLLAARSLRIQVVDHEGQAIQAEVQVQDARGITLLQGVGQGKPPRRWTALDRQGRTTLSQVPSEEHYRLVLRRGSEERAYPMLASAVEGELRTLTWATENPH